MSPASRKRSKTFAWVTAILAMAAAIAVSSPAGAQLAPPWDGNPISAGLGPTYGEAWCANAAPGSSIANQQKQPLALIPYEAIGCTLQQFLDEAVAADIPERMSFQVIGQSSGGRDLYGVVVNALETDEQERDYERWTQLRSIMLTDPAQGQALLDQWGDGVKIPIFIEANIHGNEEEGTDAMMQVVRDLVTTPYGANPVVDDLLDHAILILIPSQNPDGRFRGTRANTNGFDMNRDLLVQSQPEIKLNVAFQQEWLAPVGLAMHGYVDPTLIDGLTKPHNPGVEYDLFLEWNQPRLDVNENALADVGMNITRPVNQWNADAKDSPPPVGPAYAEGWDDWGPFYTQTYMEFFGVDSSTLEMCNSGPGCKGRFGSKRAQYVGFYSSAEFWIDHRSEILDDQVEIFRRGVAGAPRGNCCDNPFIRGLGFTEDQHNWMVPYPEAFVIPFDGGGQRSDAEANRMVQWLLDNGIQVETATRSVHRERADVPGGLVRRVDGSGTPGFGVHDAQRRTGRLGPDHPAVRAARGVEPRSAMGSRRAGDPRRSRVRSEHDTDLRPERHSRAAWWPARPTGTRSRCEASSEVRAILDLLRCRRRRRGGRGALRQRLRRADAGRLDPVQRRRCGHRSRPPASLPACSSRRVLDADKPAETTQLDEAPRVAMLAGGSGRNDTLWSLEQIFGADVQIVTMSSLLNAATDPLLGFDVIYNAGQAYPSEPQSDVARARLSDFFAGGGGYIGTSQSANNFSFLSGAGLVTSPLSQGSDSADGGIAVWTNEGIQGPLTGGFAAEDFLYLPANVTYFSSVPGDAAIDGQYLSSTDDLFLAGLWRDRNAAVGGAPIIVHGTTTANSRYLGLATNPFSRGDAEREWALIGQAALWSNLTDEA